MQLVVYNAENVPLETATLEAKTFSSGSQGFHAGGKVLIDGEKYQASFILTRIDSKPGGANHREDW